MLISNFHGFEIDGISCAVPKREISAEILYKEHNQEFTEKIRKNIAVDSIRKSIKKQLSSDLGYVAAKNIIDFKKIDTSDIGVLIYVTQTPDYRTPATSCILHKRLNLSVDCATVDINNGCAGFVYGSHIAISMLNCINSSYALLINGDSTTPKKKSKEFLDKRISVPFGDGSTAVLFKKCENSIIDISLRTNGKGYHSLIEYGNSYRWKTYTKRELKLGYRNTSIPLMNGIDVFNFSITEVPNHINEFLISQNKTINNYDYVLLHQPNLFMIKQIAKKIGANMANVPISLHKYGNTSGASIPLTLVDRFGQIDQGEISVLMCGFGTGLLWGTMSARLNIKNILPMVYSDDYFEDPEMDNYKYD